MQVGMEKQRRYEEGVQRIQSQISSVAGLNVLRPVDKQYLQSKLNELGNNLKTVAAGDFSNFQLVNSVGGMINQVGRDQRIQSNVYSTKKAQDEVAKAQKLYDEGKSSINNLNDIKDQVNEYAMSTDPNGQFNGRYVNYVDLNKKWQDLADNLKKSAPSKTKDNPYKTDGLGNTLYYKKVSAKDASGKTVTKIEASTNPNDGGVPELDDAMKRITIKGVSAQEMYDAIKNSLTEDDLAQMRIDAKAEYRGKGSESILSLYTEANRLAVNSMKDGIGRFKVLLTNPKLTSAEREEIEAKIGELESKLSRNNSEYEEGMKSLSASLSNPATLKNAQFEVYKKTKLNQTAISLSNRSYEEELRSNPYEEANHRRLVLQNQIINANRDYQLRKEKDAWEKIKWSEEKVIRARELAEKNPPPNVRDRAISTDVTTPTIGDVENKITQTTDTLGKLHIDYGRKLNMSKADLDKQYQQYLKNPLSTGKMSNDLVDYVYMRHQQEKELITQNNIKLTAEKAKSEFDRQVDEKLRSIGGVTDKNGREIFTAKDLVSVNEIIAKNWNINKQKDDEDRNTPFDSGFGGIPVEAVYPSFNEDAIFNAFKNNPKQLAIAKAVVKKIKGEQMTPTEKVIADRSSYLSNKFSSETAPLMKSGREAAAKEIMKHSSQYQQQVATLRNENTLDMNEARNVVGDMITKINTGEPLSLPSGSKIMSVDDLTKLQAEIGKGATVAIVKNNDGSATLEVQSGGSVQSIPMSADEFSTRFPKYAKVNPFTESYRSLNSSPFKTTNLGGGPGDKSSDAVNAGFWGFQAPLLYGTDYADRVRFDIIGRQENSGDATKDRYALRVFVQKPNGSWVVDDSKGGWQSSEAVEGFINNDLGIATIEDILNRNK